VRQRAINDISVPQKILEQTIIPDTTFWYVEEGDNKIAKVWKKVSSASQLHEPPSNLYSRFGIHRLDENKNPVIFDVELSAKMPYIFGVDRLKLVASHIFTSSDLLWSQKLVNFTVENSRNEDNIVKLYFAWLSEDEVSNWEFSLSEMILNTLEQIITIKIPLPQQTYCTSKTLPNAVEEGQQAFKIMELDDKAFTQALKEFEEKAELFWPDNPAVLWRISLTVNGFEHANQVTDMESMMPQNFFNVVIDRQAEKLAQVIVLKYEPLRFPFGRPSNLRIFRKVRHASSASTFQGHLFDLIGQLRIAFTDRKALRAVADCVIHITPSSLVMTVEVYYISNFFARQLLVHLGKIV